MTLCAHKDRSEQISINSIQRMNGYDTLNLTCKVTPQSVIFRADWQAKKVSSTLNKLIEHSCCENVIAKRKETSPTNGQITAIPTMTERTAETEDDDDQHQLMIYLPSASTPSMCPLLIQVHHFSSPPFPQDLEQIHIAGQTQSAPFYD